MAGEIVPGVPLTAEEMLRAVIVRLTAHDALIAALGDLVTGGRQVSRADLFAAISEAERTARAQGGEATAVEIGSYLERMKARG